jgi:hypothetical protein
MILFTSGAPLLYRESQGYPMCYSSERYKRTGKSKVHVWNSTRHRESIQSARSPSCSLTEYDWGYCTCSWQSCSYVASLLSASSYPQMQDLDWINSELEERWDRTSYSCTAVKEVDSLNKSSEDVGNRVKTGDELDCVCT